MKIIHILLVTFLVTICGAADLQRGATFVDGQRVTAAQLHQLVDSGHVLGGFYTDKTTQTNLNATDIVLVWNPTLNGFRKVTGSALLLNNLDLFTSRYEKTNPANNDFILIQDVAGNSMAKATVTNLYAFGNQPLVSTNTNGWVNYTFMAWDGTNYWQLKASDLGSNFANFFTLTNLTAQTNVNAGDLLWIYDSSGNSNKSVRADTVGAAFARGLSGFNNLVVSRSATNQVFVSHDEIVTKNGSALNWLGLTSYNIDLTVSGAGGLDTGSQATNTWYYIYAISDGTNEAGLFSIDPNSPTLPTNYVYKTLLGAAWHNQTNTFNNFYQYNREVRIVETNLLDKACTTASTYELLASTNATNFAQMVPPIAKGARGSFGVGTASVNASVGIASQTNGIGGISFYAQTITSASGFYASPALTYAVTPFFVLLTTQQNFAWRVDDNTTKCRISISGYDL